MEEHSRPTRRRELSQVCEQRGGFNRAAPMPPTPGIYKYTYVSILIRIFMRVDAFYMRSDAFYMRVDAF